MNNHMASESFYVLIVILVIVTLAYALIKKIFSRVLLKTADKFTLNTELMGDLKSHTGAFLNILYAVFILNLILSIPVVIKYAQPVLDFYLLNTEALKISLSSVVKGLIFFYVAFLITKILRKTIQVYLFYKSEGMDVVSTVDILVYNTALVVIILTTLSTIGISWKLLLPIAGALGIGLGFGLQDIANNFISGFVILMAKTVKRGDWITLGDNFGKIEDIGIRTSTLQTIDNIDIIIPNSQLISNQLINWSYSDNIVRVHIPVGVSYSSDVNLVRDTLVEVAKKSSHILNDRAIEARFLEFGNSSLDFELLGWINIKKSAIPMVRSAVNYMIWEAFQEKGIQIPFPQRDVWFKNELRIDKPDPT